MNASALQRIASKENRQYRRLLSVRAGRPDPGDESLVLLEGRRLCEEALASGSRPVLLAFSEENVEQASLAPLISRHPDGIPAFVFTQTLFRKISRTETPQGCALLCESPVVSGLPPRADPDGRYLVLEAMRDPGNVGTMIRTADAAGLSGVLLTGDSADPFNDKALRASMGSVFHLPLHRSTLGAIAEWLREAGLPLVGGTLDGDDLFLSPLPGRGAVLVGNEASGLSDQAVALCDARTRIPIPGRAESLNAAAAAAILVYAMLESSRKGR